MNPLWHVALAFAGTDRNAVKGLQRCGYHAYSPQMPSRRKLYRAKLRWQPKAMFPGYVFVRDPDAIGWGRVDTVADIHSFLIVDERHATLDDDAIAMIRMTEKTLRAQRPDDGHGWRDFRRGDAVTIAAGPFFGHGAVIDALDGPGRVAVLLEMLGRRVRTSVPPEHLIAARA